MCTSSGSSRPTSTPIANTTAYSAGRSGTIVVFDLKTLARLKEIKATGEKLPVSRRQHHVVKQFR